MKGQRHTAVLLAALAILFMAVAGFARNTQSPSEATEKPKKAKVAKPEIPEPDSDQIYVVRRGDNLTQIARKLHVSIRSLKTANGLSSSRIKAGQKLTIPVTQTASSRQTAPLKATTPAAPVEEVTARHISQLKEQNLIPDDETESTRLRLVEAGFKMIGIRYRFSGGSEKTGFDCSGLVKNLFSKFDIDLPRSSREQYKQGEKIDRDKLEVGDLVFFSSGGKRPTHVGIYVGNDKFLHAARKARQVVVSDLNKIWYSMRYLGARRIADLWNGETDPVPEQE